jgi:hypothetical protein
MYGLKPVPFKLTHYPIAVRVEKKAMDWYSHLSR